MSADEKIANRGFDNGARKRHWKWTLWIDVDRPERRLEPCKALVDGLPRGAMFHLWQVEQGSNGGERSGVHLQGHTSFRHPIGMRGVKERLQCNWVRLAWCSTQEETKNSIDYCRKDDTRVEGPYQFGDEPALQQGHRSDLDIVANLIKEGASLKRVAEEHPATYVRNYKGLAALQALLFPPKMRERVDIIVLWGPTGTGKTTRAWEAFPGAFPKNNDDWWCGYSGEAVVIWDEFDPSYWKSMTWCKLVDKFPARVPVKGSHVAQALRKIVMTSNVSPNEWQWKNGLANEAQRAAVLRRLTTIVEVLTQEQIVLWD